MAKLDPTIRHAITPPEFGEGKLHREHLVDRLHGEIPRKLVAIAAPAGYGKTTLLADFISNTEIPVVWAQLAEADRDEVRLAGVLLASLERRFRRLRGELDLGALAGEGPSSLANAIINLANENVPESFLIILDDVHLVHSSDEAVEFLDALAINLPEQATIFAAGREVLEVSLARLMAEGGLAGLGPHDLALSRDEIRRVVEARASQTLSDHELESLYSDTRGWVTGVVLSEYGGGRASLASGVTEQLAYEYLASVVLNRQPDIIRRFMLDASVLPIMTENLCNSVLSRGDSDKLLDEISSRGLFVTATVGDERSYEFHPMFRELLLETLKASASARYASLRAKAAEVLRDVDPETAISLLIETGQPESAASIAIEVAEDFFWQGRVATIQSWIDEFNREGVAVPSLQYYIAVSLMNKGLFKLAEDYLNQLATEEGLNQKLHAKVEINRAMARIILADTDKLDEILGKAGNIVSELGDDELLGRYHRLRANKARSVDRDLASANQGISKAVEAFERAGNMPLLVAAMQDQFLFFTESGRLRTARAVALRTSELAEKLRSPVAEARSLNNLGYIEYTGGEFDSALQYYDMARATAKRAGLSGIEAFSTFGQAETYADLGLTIQAAMLYDQGLDIASSLESNTLLTMGCLGTSILHRRSGSFRLAGEWLKRAVEYSDASDRIMLDVQRAALIGESDGAQAVRDLRLLVAQDILSPEEETIALFLISKYLLEGGMEDAAEESFRECLEFISLHGSVQAIAPEIASSPRFHAWTRRVFRDHPTYELIGQRIELSSALSSHYDRPDDDQEVDGLIVRTLGTSQVILKGEMVEELKPQALELFFYLVDRASAERDEIAEMFWDGHAVGRQTANLHMAIYSIRRQLGKDSVLLDGTVYRLNEDYRIRYDVELFENAVRVVNNLPPGDPRRLFALTEAVSHYKGKYLAEFFSDWVLERRRQLELDFLDIAADHAEEALLRDQPGRALESLRSALSLDPYRDDINERYIRVLSRLNRRSDVVAHYRQYERLMREDLGLEPSRELKQLHDDIAQGG